MRKVLLVVAFCVLSFPASAHENRILPIKADGTIDALPAVYGTVKVHIDRSPHDPHALTGVAVSSPRFHVKLEPCVLSKLKAVTRVEASGSWYHDLNEFPPYLALNFYTDGYNPKSPINEHYSITFSLADGKILMGQRVWDPRWGTPRGELIEPADKCSGWRRISMRSSVQSTFFRGRWAGPMASVPPDSLFKTSSSAG